MATVSETKVHTEPTRTGSRRCSVRAVLAGVIALLSILWLAGLVGSYADGEEPSQFGAAAAACLLIAVGLAIIPSVVGCGSTVAKADRHRTRTGVCLGISVGLATVLFFSLAIGRFMLGGATADGVLVGMMAIGFFGCGAVFAVWLAIGKLAPRVTQSGTPRRCTVCCTGCCMPIYLLFVFLGMWHALMYASFRASVGPLGTLYAVEGGHQIHLHCTGPVTSAPTVMCSHGFGGSSYEWETLRRSPSLAPYRICTNDRPSHGFSGPWRSGPRTYKRAARMVVSALMASGVSGPVVLVGQSMGNLFSLSLAGEIALTPSLTVVGAVAIDGMDPMYECNNELNDCYVAGETLPRLRPPQRCNSSAPQQDFTNWEISAFYLAFKAGLPYGLTRLGYEMNIGENKDFVAYFHPSVIDAQRDLALTDGYFSGVLIEVVEFWRNCGAAADGEPAYAGLPFEILTSQGNRDVDPTGVPTQAGLNFTTLTRLSSRSNLTTFPLYAHSTTLIYKEVAQGPVADAIVRVLHA